MQDYDSIISRLFERHQSVQSAGFSSEAYKPGLGSTLEMDARAGHPSEQLRCIHVAGTNGKGSVASMLAAAFAATGLRVGLYTSPHLLDFRERIKVLSGGTYVEEHSLITRKAVLEFIGRWEKDFDELKLSFFEITTVMAFWWFAQKEVDIAIIEVGLGGRLDSTNIIDPDLCIVTSIGLDHCALLGSTRAEIAREKAGIFKKSVPALVGEWDDETGPVFEEVAREVGCPVFFADRAPVPEGLIEASQLDLKGEYQGKNLRTVLSAFLLLRGYYGELLVPPVLDAIRNAASRTGFHGRWEKLDDAPLTICDIGHNPPALKENMSQLRRLMDSGVHDRLVILYGVMADKALDDIIPLLPKDAYYVFVTPDTPRAMKAETIAGHFATAGFDGSSICIGGSVAEGLRTAMAMATEKSLVYVGGSTYVVSDAIKAMKSDR